MLRNESIPTTKLHSNTLAEFLYNTATVAQLDERLIVGPSQFELRKWQLTEQAWQLQVLSAKKAIELD